MITSAGLIRTTLREQVLESLHASILDGSLPPGTKLGEVELSERLGVSRGTIREALRHLQQAGLVEGTERNSLYVSSLSPAQVIELFQLRASLESMATMIIMSRDDRDEVIGKLEELANATKPDETLRELLNANLAFHEAICAMSGNAMLLKAWTTVKDLMFVIAVQGEDNVMTELLATMHHRSLVDAMRSGDLTKARTAVESHLLDSAPAWAKLVKSGPAE